MLKYVAIILALTSSFAFADKKKVKYNTKFVNPIVDDRINFTTCAVEGALYGILTEEYGDVLCLGLQKTDKERVIYAFKGKNSSKVLYFEETESKIVAGAGDEAGGMRVHKSKLKSLNSKLEEPEKPKRTTLTYTESWLYSDGSNVVKGTIPRARASFEASVYYLGPDLDRELREFADELNN